MLALKSKLLGIVTAVVFTGQLPFLLLNRV